MYNNILETKSLPFSCTKQYCQKKLDILSCFSIAHILQWIHLFASKQPIQILFPHFPRLSNRIYIILITKWSNQYFMNEKAYLIPELFILPLLQTQIRWWRHLLTGRLIFSCVTSYDARIRWYLIDGFFVITITNIKRLVIGERTLEILFNFL